MTELSRGMMNVPHWATSMVSNFRKDAKIPESVNDVTLFVAIESQDICVYNPEYQVNALRAALGLEAIDDC